MPSPLTSTRRVSKKFAAVLRTVRLATALRRVGRGISRVPLEPLITVVEASDNIASSVPFVQGITSTVATLMKRAEDVKQNRKECKELAQSAERVISLVVAATSGISEDEMDDKMKLNLAELEWQVRMERIVGTMTKLGTQSAVRRFWRKDKHAAALAEHQRALNDALNEFQVKESIAGRLAQRRVMSALSWQLEQKLHREPHSDCGSEPS
ncbi:hypothetical protein BV20DRAFT_1052293 [Pilatotrama ljubarskyi]|nr:hypothetical protein BV20DRAFT_1052293 [Pilatotrama ljubarskyi]